MNDIYMVYLVYGMACWRLTSLLIREEGPYNSFGIIREWVGIIHDSDRKPMGYPETLLGKLFECSWCLSVWIAGALVLGYIFLPTISFYFALWLSLSTITILIEEVI